MTQLERKKIKLKELLKKHKECCLAGHMVKAVALMPQINELRDSIAIEEYTQPAGVGEFLSHDSAALVKSIDLCVKLHIAADYVAKTSLDLQDYLLANGFELKTFTSEFRQLAADATRLASRLFRKKDTFEATIVDDDTLLAAIDKKVESYIEQRRVRGNKKESKQEPEVK